MDDLNNRFNADAYTIRRKVLKLVGGAFHIYDPEGQLLLYSKQKAFKLKEDIRLFTGEDMTDEILCISARNVIDFSAGYDVHDSRTGEFIGTLYRRGFKSMIRDEWEVADEDGRSVATIREDSTVSALVRRFIKIAALIMPQKYHIEVDGRTRGMFHQNKNPFVFKMDVDLSMDPDREFDRRLGVAAGLLLTAIEGRQNS